MKPMLNFEYRNQLTKIEESKGQTFIEGCLISEGKSENGNVYSFESLRSIAESAVSAPLYYGTEPQTNRHTKASGQIGRIVKTWFNKKLAKVFFKAVITSKKIAESVREGFGVSIGGIADGYNVLDKAGKIILKIRDCIVNHVQLLNPFTRRGMADSKVHRVVSESMIFRSYHNNKPLTAQEITLIVQALSQSGEI